MLTENKNQIDQLSEESAELDLKIKSQQNLVEIMQEELMKGQEDNSRPESDMLVQELEKEQSQANLFGSMKLLNKISQRQELLTLHKEKQEVTQ